MLFIFEQTVHNESELQSFSFEIFCPPSPHQPGLHLCVRDRRTGLPSEHWDCNQSCHTACIPAMSQSHHDIIFVAAVARVIHLIHFTFPISLLLRLLRSNFTPLISPLLNPCFLTATHEFPCRCSDGRVDARR